jgi:enoyl-CoA hydratase/carnithine racemase
MDLLMSSRKIDAAEALSMGFVSRVLAPEDLLPAAREWALTLATSVSPRSVRVMKRQLWESPMQSLAEAMVMANDEMFKSIQSEDFTEGVAHFIERRAPSFTGR